MKEVYTRPVVNRVELVLDQAVLGNCKTAALAPGPLAGGADCETGTGQQCYYIGS